MHSNVRRNVWNEKLYKSKQKNEEHKWKLREEMVSSTLAGRQKNRLYAVED